jgi:hypothetical protein
MAMYKTKWEKDRAHGQRKRLMIQEFKKVPCMDCGIQYPPYVMDFDHRDPATKVLNISKVYHFGKQKLLDEIEKCDVVCSNCHRERSHQQKLARLAQLEDAAVSKTV